MWHGLSALILALRQTPMESYFPENKQPLLPSSFAKAFSALQITSIKLRALPSFMRLDQKNMKRSRSGSENLELLFQDREIGFLYGHRPLPQKCFGYFQIQLKNKTQMRKHEKSKIHLFFCEPNPVLQNPGRERKEFSLQCLSCCSKLEMEKREQDSLTGVELWYTNTARAGERERERERGRGEGGVGRCGE